MFIGVRSEFDLIINVKSNVMLSLVRVAFQNLLILLVAGETEVSICEDKYAHEDVFVRNY